MVNYTPIHNRKPTKRQLAQINAHKKRQAAAFGGDYHAYLRSKQPPLSPTKTALRNLKNSSVGDKDYEREEILNDKFLHQADKKFWLENDDWFHPDGSRKYSDPEDQKAWDRLNGRNRNTAVKTQPAKVEQAPVQRAEPAQPAFQLPTMMAPMPGQRHMLFNQQGFNAPRSGNRSSFMTTAFSNPVHQAQPQAVNSPQTVQKQTNPHLAALLGQQQGPAAAQTAQMPQIAMPSNLNRFYALQAGAQQTPFAHLISDHVRNTNVKRGNPENLNATINPYPFLGAGYGSPQQPSFGSAFNPSKYQAGPFHGVNPAQLGQRITNQ